MDSHTILVSQERFNKDYFRGIGEMKGITRVLAKLELLPLLGLNRQVREEVTFIRKKEGLYRK